MINKYGKTYLFIFLCYQELWMHDVTQFRLIIIDINVRNTRRIKKKDLGLAKYTSSLG